MRRILLYLIVAMTMFIVGVTVNTMVNVFGWFAVEKTKPAQTELRSNFLDIGFRQPDHCRNLVLSVTSDGALYLKGSEMGTLRDTNQLKARLSEIFALRTERRIYRDTFDLRLAVPQDRPIEKTVFITAPRNTSYGEVTDLIKVVREAGADPIGLVSY